ncbi:MAG: TIGR00730 family Rossman fold protein [Candidatus Latescibacteria bacterium]|nr:TIGR00730 family Rossman fold protein [Candidatus Latescibacterota bacterium]
MHRICVFTGSNNGTRDEYAASARILGHELAARDIGLVYGGGDVGLMGIIADAALAAQGEVFGVIPNALMDRELGHAGVTKLYIVDSMHTRKARMAELSDGFIALPGGFGTLEELFEVITWAQLEFHSKPVGLLNVGGFYDHLLEFLSHVKTEGFVKKRHHDILMVDQSPGDLIDRMTARALILRE